MEENTKDRILDASIMVFAKHGYAQATIEGIAKRAKVTISLIYFHFKGGKPELLISILIRFWLKVNKAVMEEIVFLSDPFEKLRCIIKIIYSTLTKNKKSLYLSKVLGELVPTLLDRKDDKIKSKRDLITKENTKFLRILDTIITEGQSQGIFTDITKPCLVRQILYGSIQMIIYGCYLQDNKISNVGYDKKEARQAVNELVKRFLIEDQQGSIKNRNIFNI